MPRLIRCVRMRAFDCVLAHPAACGASLSGLRRARATSQHAPAAGVAAGSQSDTVSTQSNHHDTPSGRNSPAQDGVLGPMLPYNEQDEELLLSVMITRQSGTGLGFKLTPSYLLQMCIAYCVAHRPRDVRLSACCLIWHAGRVWCAARVRVLFAPSHVWVGLRCAAPHRAAPHRSLWSSC